MVDVKMREQILWQLYANCIVCDVRNGNGRKWIDCDIHLTHAASYIAGE